MREAGYYWVKFKITGWLVAEYDSYTETWSYNNDCCKDYDIDKVNENRILNPDDPIEKISDDLIMSYGWRRNLKGDDPSPRSFIIEFKFMWSDHEPIQTECAGSLSLYYSRDGYMKISKEMTHYDCMFSGGCSNKNEFLMLMNMLEVKKFLNPDKK